MNSTPLGNFRKTSLALAVMAVICSTATLNARATAAGASSLVTVAHTTKLGRGDAITGALEMMHPIHIEVALKLRNRDVLDAFIANNAKNQAQGKAAQLMSRDQLMANHAPTQAQAQKVANYLTSMGYKNVVIAPDRLLISADGTAATARNAFMTSFDRIKTHDGRIAFANNQEVFVPASLQDSILSVVGLQTVHQAHTLVKWPLPNAVHTDAVTGHNPIEFASIYSGTGVATAKGVTVGIFANGDVSASIADLNAFTKTNGLATVSTQVVTTNGGGNDPSGRGEWDVDSQDIVGMGGSQVGQLIFYTAPTLGNADMLANFHTIVGANAAKIINVSIGGCEAGAEADGTAYASDQILAVGVAQGQTFSISTGDSGADECNNGGITPSWPADSPYAVAVAGTTLDSTSPTPSTPAAWISEVVWGGSGGSPSTFEPKPSWQDSLVPGSTRGVADVAFDADPNSGVLITLSSGGTALIGGTSLAAPIFSGLWARVIATKGTTVGFAAPLIYGLPEADFHDITVGNNDGESAKVGYDFASGRGSIILNAAINDIGVPIGGAAPVPNFSFTTTGLNASFTDSSTRSGGTIVSRYWNFGDNRPVVTVTNPTHGYLGAGTYNVSETVVDNSGNFRTKISPVTVVAPGGSNQLIANAGFETTGFWMFSSANIRNNNAFAAAPHGGQWDAWLGADGSGSTDSISQQVTIPSGKTSATLQYFLHIDTQEVTQTRKFDNMTVGVYSTGGALLGTLASYSNLNAAAGYQVQTFSLAPWIGQTVVLQFSSRLDSSLQTNFVVDDVTLLAK